MVPFLPTCLELNYHAIQYLGVENPTKKEKYSRNSRRVRHIRLGDTSRPSGALPRISFSAFAWLGCELGSKSFLLPALRSVELYGPRGGSQELSFLSLILSPSANDITSVLFNGEFIFDKMFLSHTLPLVRLGTPSLRHLSLSDPSSTSDDSVWEPLLKVALKDVQLETLVIRFPFNNTLPPLFLCDLSPKMGNIRSLTLDVHTLSHGPSDNPLHDNSIVIPDQALIHLINRSETSLCPCFPRFLLHRATSITFYLSNSNSSESAFDSALDALSGIQPLSRLEIKSDVHGVLIHPAAISRIIQRLDLEELRIETWGLMREGFQRGEEVSTILASVSGHPEQSKKRLSSLTLPIWRPDQLADYRPYYSYPESLPPPYPCIDTLFSVARHATQLYHISVSINSSVVKEGSQDTLQSLVDGWTSDGPSSELRILELADMRPSDSPFRPVEYRQIARLLDTIFPNLEVVRMIDNPRRGNTWDEHWELIDEHRRLAKSVRMYRSARQT